MPLSRGLIAGIVPERFLPSWMGCGDPANNGAFLVADANAPGDMRLSRSVVPIILSPAYAATYTTDCSLGSHIRMTLTGNLTLANPINMVDGQMVKWEFIQDATGSRTLTLGSAFALGTDITAVTLTTTANKRDLIGAVYNVAAAKWFVIALARGY